MYDAALFYADLAARKSSIVEDLRLTPEQYVLSTVHRAENTDDPARLLSILDALSAVSREVDVVLPLHPRTLKAAESMNITFGEIKVIPPVSYLDMIQLERHSQLIMTDSGGVQKEAYFFRKPCITLRDETEWAELVEAQVNSLAGTEVKTIMEAYLKMKEGSFDFSNSFYGSGSAGREILVSIINGQ
jgi:UDP-GlcNAc3NAcA epimerase